MSEGAKDLPLNKIEEEYQGTSRQETNNLYLTCLAEYGITDPKILQLIAQVWEEKNRMFDGLLSEQKQLLKFHNEDHTNRVVSLLSQALIGIKKQGETPSVIGSVAFPQKEVPGVIVAAIGHDLGNIIGSPSGGFMVDLSLGHEERSKARIRAILKNSLDREIIGQEQFDYFNIRADYINSTKHSYTASSLLYQDNPGKILNAADLCAGVSFASSAYLDKLSGLWQEMEITAGGDLSQIPYRSFQDLVDSRTAKDSNFMIETIGKIQPFLSSLDYYYQEKGINPVRVSVTKNWIPVALKTVTNE